MSENDALQRSRQESEAVYGVAKELQPGDTVTAKVEMVRLPGSPSRTLELTVSEVESGVGPDFVDGSADVYTTDEDGEAWRIRSVAPTEMNDGMDHNGTANLYMGDAWAQNIGVVRELETNGDADE